MLVLVIDGISPIQEVVLQAFEQIIGEVGLSFFVTCVRADFGDAFLDDSFVAGIRDIDGLFFEPCGWPTGGMRERPAMGVETFVVWAVIMLLGYLAKELIDNLLGNSSTGVNVVCLHYAFC